MGVTRSPLLLLGGLVAGLVTGAVGASAQSPEPDAPPERYRAVLEWSVGDLDGALTLTRVEHLVVHGSRLFVSQPQERLIRVLSAENGEPTGIWAGEGDGPGEFRRISWMGTLNGELAVLDARATRVTRFGEDGAASETIRYRPPPASPPHIFGAWVVPTAGGKFIHFGDLGVYSQGADRARPRWLVTDERGVVGDTLPSYHAADRSITFETADGRRNSLSRPLHRGDRFASAIDASSFVQVGMRVEGTLSIERYDSEASSVGQVALRLAPVRVPPTVRDSLEAGLREMFAQRGLTASLRPRELDELVLIPEWVPPVDELFVTSEGEIWLREPSFSRGTGHLWRVLDQNGRLVAEVEVPSEVVLRDRAGPHLFGVRIDPEWGYPTVQRYRLERTGG